MVFVTPWKYHPKYVEQFPDVNKLRNVASCWIYIGILLGAHPILHVSRIRVKNDIRHCGSIVMEGLRKNSYPQNCWPLNTSLKPTQVKYKSGNFATFLLGSVSKVPLVNFCQALCTNDDLDMHLLFRAYFPRASYDCALDLMFCS
jgi:hypothetical protein